MLVFSLLYFISIIPSSLIRLIPKWCQDYVFRCLKKNGKIPKISRINVSDWRKIIPVSLKFRKWLETLIVSQNIIVTYDHHSPLFSTRKVLENRINKLAESWQRVLRDRNFLKEVSAWQLGNRCPSSGKLVTVKYILN